jgi:tryptophanyl-tRNA synthetase
MKKPKRILSGIRATGNLHLGNYLGMVKGMLEQQERGDYDIFFMVADLHATTTPFNPSKLRQQRREVVVDYLSAGLDPQKSTVFLQSDVPQHTELATYLATTITIARMQHLPTFKEKVKQYPKQATMALLNYPILMAADILAYKSDLVPTGIDQEPHLEVAREIARKMNDAYGTDFPEPRRFATKGEYVPSLLGEGKMSKSVEGSYINLTDDLNTIKIKLASAPTDSGQGDRIPSTGGVANLLTFVELFQGEAVRKEYERQYSSTGIRYHDLKEELAQAIYQELQPMQALRQELEAEPERVNRVIKEGAQKAQAVAGQTVAEVKHKMGLA